MHNFYIGQYEGGREVWYPGKAGAISRVVVGAN